MAEDRRSAPRASLPGVRVTYESAGGEPREAEVTNLGTGGLFLRSDTPIAVGKRMSLDLHVAGESSPWTALGRIVWSRPADEGPGRPAGMGVKLIDVEDSVLSAIESLVAGREPTEPGVGHGPSAPTPQAPPRERTMLGVGNAIAARPEANDLAHVAGAPASAPVDVPEGPPEPAIELDVPPPPVMTPEPSLAIELVAKKVDSGRASAETGAQRRSARARGRRRVAAVSALVVVATAAGSAYVYRDRLPSLWQRFRSTVTQAIDRVR
jgi:uncharacterized protein (TIGR02266 family)